MDYKRLFDYFVFLAVFLLFISIAYADSEDIDREKPQPTVQKGINSGWLGVRVADLVHFAKHKSFYEEFREIIDSYRESGEELFGVAVLETVPGSPAEEYGILPGYIIKRVQRIRIDNTFTFSFIINKIEPGELIELEIWNPKGNYNIYTRIADRPAEIQRSEKDPYYRQLEREKARAEKPGN